MKTYIELTKEAKKRLADALNCGEKIIYLALSGRKTETELTRKIRKLALKEYGGIEMMSLPISECMHDIDGYVSQIFRNGAELRWRKDSSCIQITSGKGETYTYNVPGIERIREIQAFAEQL